MPKNKKVMNGKSKFEVEFKRLMDEIDNKRLEKEQDKPMIDRFAVAVVKLGLQYPKIYAESMLKFYKDYAKLDEHNPLNPEERMRLAVMCEAISNKIYDKRLILDAIEAMLEFNPDTEKAAK